MIYGSLQAEFMETKYNSHIHRYVTSIFGKIIVDISKLISNNNQMPWMLYNMILFDMPSIRVMKSVGGSLIYSKFFITRFIMMTHYYI